MQLFGRWGHGKWGRIWDVPWEIGHREQGSIISVFNLQTFPESERHYYSCCAALQLYSK